MRARSMAHGLSTRTFAFPSGLLKRIYNPSNRFACKSPYGHGESWPTWLRQMGAAMGAVHKLLDEHGKKNAVEQVRTRRPERIIEAASASMLDEQMGEFSTIIYSGWCHAGLPHRKTPSNEDWQIKTDYVTLVVEPGRVVKLDGSFSYLGVPYGANSRLILYYLMDRALVTGDRTVEMGRSLNNFLGRLGLSQGGKTNKSVRDQIERISRCKLTFHLQKGNMRGVSNQAIVDSAVFFDSDRGHDERQSGLFTDTIRLSEGFYQQLQRHAVRLDERAICKIHNNSRALDVYSWLAFRLHHLDEPTFVPWATLRPQFGAGIRWGSNFTPVMRDDLLLALSVYEQASVEIQEKGIVLRPSPPPVPVPARGIRSVQTLCKSPDLHPCGRPVTGRN